MLTSYVIQTPSLVDAIAIAQNRARLDGYPRASVVGTRQLNSTTYEIRMMVSR